MYAHLKHYETLQTLYKADSCMYSHCYISVTKNEPNKTYEKYEWL